MIVKLVAWIVTAYLGSLILVILGLFGIVFLEGLQIKRDIENEVNYDRR